MVRNTLFLGLLPLLASASPLPVDSGAHLDPRAQSTFTDCLGAGKVPIIMQSWSSFNTLASPYNLRLKYKPSVIVIPTTTQHISSTVKCAKQFRVKVSARGGGHSYSAQGLGGANGAAVIDMQRFHDVVYDASTELAQVGGGARLGNIARKLYDQAKRGIPHGTCPAVGMGHPSLGGFGISSRYWGLMADQIYQVEVVTADGSIKTARKNYNGDLFWALKGAAPSFGIITKFWFKTYAVPESIVNYSYSFTGLSVDQAAAAFIEIQNFAKSAPKELGLGVSLWGNGVAFELSGAYYGKSQQDFDNMFQPLLGKLPAPSSSTVNVKGWIDTLLRFAGNGGSLSVPEIGYNEHTTFYAKSLVTSQTSPLSLDSMKSFFNYAANQGPGASNQGLPWFVIINLYGGGNSAINNPALLNESSYGHRDSLWNFQFYTTMSNGLTTQSNTNALSFLNGFDQSVRRSWDAAYVNYADPTYSRADSHKLYYGGQYGKLQLVKKKYDRDQVFWYPQSIDPAA
ncbi:hypothetical protein H072_4489 [Dactylellina haptotyla CBS 200.50]|uniref:FAD-binding PCMH-type domain-containing protein n=1 Tax=Dactylellina haptotyla (strain CBS 200.50) TaxID=1284197 RepID=S8C1X8_DACHA|nr:hypothetical protein H072_4489 [Dactylellina haptotyla CBS 200.50]